MQKKRISEKNLNIKLVFAASGQKVWNTMLDAETYKQWVAAGWPGSYYEGKWGKGENDIAKHF